MGCMFLGVNCKFLYTLEILAYGLRACKDQINWSNLYLMKQKKNQCYAAKAWYRQYSNLFKLNQSRVFVQVSCEIQMLTHSQKGFQSICS